MKIAYRLFNPDDIGSLCELWNENAEWGLIDPEQWKKVFYNTPFGPSTIVLATNQANGEVLAQFVFIPTKISINGNEVSAFKPCAPIIKKSLREESGMASLFVHMLKMYRFACKHFVSEGIYLLHMMPDPRWVRGFEVIPGMKIASFPLWCFPLEKELEQQLPEGYALESIHPSDPRISELWSKASKLYDCAIARDTGFLTYKLSHRNYQYLGLTHHSKLVGFAAYIFKDIIKGVTICDVLAEDENALRITLDAMKATASQLKSGLPEEKRVHCEKLSILATPMIQKIVSDLGFVKNNYKFSLAVHVLGKQIPKKDVKPERWYVSAND